MESPLVEDYGCPPPLEAMYEADERLFREYSGCRGPWRIAPSPWGGRGLFTTRALRAGETVLRDPALVLAPRGGGAAPQICQRCHCRPSAAPLRPCQSCGLPVCCDEATPDRHEAECRLLQRWGAATATPKDCNDLVSASAALRCMTLSAEGKKILMMLLSHQHPRHETAVDLLKRLSKGNIPQEHLRLLRHVCCVLDSNAFETPVDGSRCPDALACRMRGLYPLSAMMNHTCTPNTTHGYDAAHAMVMRAATPLPEGAELTTSYAPLLWGTPARRRHLAVTKHFLCACPRCQDPQEGGVRLSALRCGRPNCEGSMFCDEPLNNSSSWSCETCAFRLTYRQADAVQGVLGSILGSVDTTDPDTVRDFLRRQKALSATNQVTVELRCCIIWLYGHTQRHRWQGFISMMCLDLSEDQLLLKDRLCREILQVLEQLGAGRCRLRGLFLYELHCTQWEQSRRLQDFDNKICDLLESLEEAADIFKKEAMVPEDLYSRLAEAKAKRGTTRRKQLQQQDFELKGITSGGKVLDSEDSDELILNVEPTLNPS